MATSTVENYLKQIFLIAHESKTPVVPMGKIATALGVVPGTATTMIKSLQRDQLLKYQSRVGVTLTPKGEKLAIQILRRHRIIELFLAKTLGMDWSEIHEEAEMLEHAMSERVINRIDAFLGHPKTDPHGDQIPDANGKMIERNLKRLTSCNQGDMVDIVQIKDQHPEFLKFIHEHKITPGARVRITNHNKIADSIALELDSGENVTFGCQAAEKIFVS